MSAEMDIFSNVSFQLLHLRQKYAAMRILYPMVLKVWSPFHWHFSLSIPKREEQVPLISMNGSEAADIEVFKNESCFKFGLKVSQSVQETYKKAYDSGQSV